MRTLEADLCIVGGGSGGLSVAAGAAQMGARVVLFEKGKMGGDCLNYGCVPSKSLIAAADTASTIRNAARFGVNGHEPEVDVQGVQRHIRDVIAGIAPHDSVERFERLGVTVIEAAARFSGPREVCSDDFRVRARRFVLATGSSPAVPPIQGLDGVPYYTNETIFDLGERPEHLIVIGGGPIGCELAQSHRRLGSAVTIVELFSLLAKDDPEAAEVVRQSLIADGITVLEGAKIVRVERDRNRIAVVLQDAERFKWISGSHLLIAAGRRANLAHLNLETAGIAHTPLGVKVDARLRTTNRRVFAIGDLAGGYQFTHMAGYHAGIVIRNALFRLPAKVNHEAVPWVTFTDPELAQVGLTEPSARDKHEGRVSVLKWPFADIDRARAERHTHGFVKIVVGRRGRVLGATLVGRHAGELLLPWCLAVARHMSVGAIANLIVPYPTLSEASKRAAGSYFTPSLFSERTRRIVRFLQRLP